MKWKCLVITQAMTAAVGRCYAGIPLLLCQRICLLLPEKSGISSLSAQGIPLICNGIDHPSGIIRACRSPTHDHSDPNRNFHPFNCLRIPVSTTGMSSPPSKTKTHTHCCGTLGTATTVCVRACMLWTPNALNKLALSNYGSIRFA